MKTPAILAAILGVSSISLAQQPAAPRASTIFESEIVAFEKKDKANPPPQNAYLFVGSSSFRLWKNLETAFPGKQVINRGFGGSEVRDSTYYADRIIAPYHPKMVLLYAGDNDIASGRSAKQVLDDFTEFTAKVRSALPGVKIGFVTIKPSPSRWKYIDAIRKANSLVKGFVRKQKNMVYINIFDAMLDADGQPIPEYYREDKLHPTEAAYEKWQKIIAPYLK